MSKTTIIDLEEEVVDKSNDLAGLLEDPSAMLDFVKPKQYELPQPATLPEEPSVDYFEPPYKETKEEEDTELSYEDVDGFVRNARFNSMGLVEKENDLEKEERFKIYKMICWNMILNRVKYHLCMN